MKILRNAFKNIQIQAFAMVLGYTLVASDFIFSYTQLGPYPVRNYFAVFISLLGGAYSIKNRISLDNKYLLIAIYPFFLATGLISDLANNGGINWYFHIKPFLKFTFLFFACQVLIELIGVKKLSKIIILTALLTGIIAILQAMSLEYFWSLRFFIDEKSMWLAKGRPTGLAYFSVILSEQLLVAFILSLYFLFKKEKYSVLVSSILLLALVLSGTRSAILGLVISFIIFGRFFLQSSAPIIRQKAVTLSLPFITVVAAVYLKNPDLWHQVFGRYIYFGRSTGSRVYASIAALNVIKDNAFIGLGSQYLEYKQIIAPYMKHLKQLNLNIDGILQAPNMTPHNFYLNYTVIYGATAIIGLLIHHIFAFKLIRDHKNKSWSKIGTITFTAIIINSLFHNGGILNSACYTMALAIIVSAEKEDYSKQYNRSAT